MQQSTTGVTLGSRFDAAMRNAEMSENVSRLWPDNMKGMMLTVVPVVFAGTTRTTSTRKSELAAGTRESGLRGDALF